jgi:hypothetical protein
VAFPEGVTCKVQEARWGSWRLRHSTIGCQLDPGMICHVRQSMGSAGYSFGKVSSGRICEEV